ncbi:MAG: hypothetical protein PVI19_10305, partial [Syntrophobacterales bacterium]
GVWIQVAQPKPRGLCDNFPTDLPGWSQTRCRRDAFAWQAAVSYQRGFHFKVNHRGTEDTEGVIFPWPGDPPASPCSHGGLATAREKDLRLRRKLFSLSPTVDMKPPGY